MLGSFRARLAFGHDLVMTVTAFILAMFLRVDSNHLQEYVDSFVFAIPVLLIAAVVSYQYLGLYRGIWRYASSPDLVQVGKAVTATILGFLLVMFLINRLDSIPRSVPLIQWFIQIVLLGGPRFAYRLLKDRRSRVGEVSDGRTLVLLLGATDGAELFIRSVVSDPHSPYRVVGVLDDNGRRVGRAIRGVPVLGSVADLSAVIADLLERDVRPNRLVLTRSRKEIEGTEIRRLLEEANRLGLSLSWMSRTAQVQDEEGTDFTKVELKPVAIVDLLGRPQAVLDADAIAGFIRGRRVVVTGAGGTIGSELATQILGFGPAQLVLCDNSEFNLYTIEQQLCGLPGDADVQAVMLDVRNRERTMRVFERFRPELVFHAAALKHVPMVEKNVVEGALTNVIGTRNVADAALSVGARAMVQISTDKVVRPSSVMGGTKRFAEAYCQALDLASAEGGGKQPTRFMTVRFGNVLGSSGSVVPLFQQQLAAGGPLTVTHPEMRRYFMTVREAVSLVLQASAQGVKSPSERGKIMVLDMGEPVYIVELARQVIRLAGLRPDIDVKIEFTGIRPGEKLFEELFDPAEAPTVSGVNGVAVASPIVVDLAQLKADLASLEQAAMADDAGRVLGILERVTKLRRADAARTANIEGTAGNVVRLSGGL